MKKFLLTIICFAAIATGFAQTGFQYINYQGVARNAAGQPLANTTIYTYTEVYDSINALLNNTNYFVETRTVTTNQFGLFSMQVGSPGGVPIRGTVYNELRWDLLSQPKLKVYMRLNPTVNYTLIGTVTLGSVPYARMATQARPWKYGTLTNPSISPDQTNWRLGLGTDTATEKLHVVGKLRLVDGTQATDRILTSDANGVASWKTPAAIPAATPNYFTLNQNNVGAGINYLSLSDTNRGLSIGTRSGIAGGPGLAVNGPLQFTGNGAVGSVNTIRNDDVLTTDGSGNARWKSLADNTYASPWVTGSYSIFPNTIQTKQTLSMVPVYSHSRMIVRPDDVLTGDYFNLDSYPMRVSNGQHGLAIRLPFNTNQTNKFITFFDASGIKGRIEGQTVADLQEDPEYITYITLQTLATGGFLAEGIACGFQLDFFEVAVQAAQLGIWAADLGSQIAFKEGNAGVSYQSGNGDYAEWLEKKNLSERFSFGDIVSAVGGKITKNTTLGGQLMVISKAPIVLGKIPDETKKASYEMVAFMGQVPVKVRGVVAVGDYILATGAGDGVGYAVNPQKITTEEMQRIVGVAWDAADGSSLVSLINTAVGVNTHAATAIIEKQQNKIALLENQFNQLSAFLQSKDPSYQYTKINTESVAVENTMKEVAAVKTAKPANNPFAELAGTYGKLKPAEQIRKVTALTAGRVKKLLDEQPQFLDAAIKIIKEKSEANHLDIDSNPQLKRILNDRVFLIETIKKAYNI